MNNDEIRDFNEGCKADVLTARKAPRPMSWMEMRVEAATDVIDTLLARVEALEAERAWRPIESAPKDGTMFFAQLEDGSETIVKWSKEYTLYDMTEGWHDATQWNYDDSGGWLFECDSPPAKWRPLAPPKTKEIE